MARSIWRDRDRRVSCLAISGPAQRPDAGSERREDLESRAAAARDEQLGRVRADSWDDRSLADRCILGFNAGPPMTPGAYNNHVQIFQAAGHVVLVTEMVHDVRVIPVDGTAHLPSRVRQYRGDSRGRWEGRTLVIDTTNFLRETSFRGSSANLYVT